MEGNYREARRTRLSRWLQVGLAAMLALQFVWGTWPGHAQAAEASIKEQVSQAVSGLQSVLNKSEPLSDWAAFGLARSGVQVGERYWPLADKAVDGGSLRLVTDYARIALAVNATGGDASQVGADKVNLLKEIANFEKITVQGPNAPAYALLALDAANYTPGASDRWTRDDLIKWLIDNRNEDGGWSLATGKSDVDITAIVLAALANDQERAEVAAVIDEALNWLSGVQRETGGFGAATESSESSAQVLIALAALGIDSAQDSRFVKNGKSVLARLLDYRLADGQFSHLEGGKADGIATFNAFLGLTAVERWMDGLPGLYAGVPTGNAASVSVNGLEGTIATGEATGRTALEVLIDVLNQANIAYGVDIHPQFGAMLQSIAGVENGKFGGYDGWQYAVKRAGSWVMIGEGMASFAMQTGDKLVVYYGGGETVLIHSVKIEPSEPREGQSIVVKVEQEVLDWETGELIVSAAAGALVQAGGQSAKTDQEGNAQLEALQAGAYTLTVDGYRSDAPPLYVAWAAPLEVAAAEAEAGAEAQVSVRIEGDAGAIASGRAQGANALEAIEQLLQARGVKNEIVESSFGKYIASIDGVASGKYGGYDGWMFAVVRDGAWVIPAVGADAYELEDGDEVVVYYSGDATQLAEPLSVSPAWPKPGEDLTVTVTNRAWNWTTNEFDAAVPVAGAKVSVGDVSAVTDEHGQAVLAGLPEGMHELEVSGYEQDAAPRLVRSVTAVAVADSYEDQSAVAGWALDAVVVSRASQFLRGVDDGLTAFKPKQTVTRAEFVSSLARVLGLTAEADAPAAFKDIPAGAWYASDVAAAAAAGLAAGVSANSFAPEAELTREQAAILLARALKLKAAVKATDLVDAGQVGASAVKSVQSVIEAGWMTPYQGRFMPKAPLTREQAAVIVVRVQSAI